MNDLVGKLWKEHTRVRYDPTNIRIGNAIGGAGLGYVKSGPAGVIPGAQWGWDFADPGPRTPKRKRISEPLTPRKTPRKGSIASSISSARSTMPRATRKKASRKVYRKKTTKRARKTTSKKKTVKLSKKLNATLNKKIHHIVDDNLELGRHRQVDWAYGRTLAQAWSWDSGLQTQLQGMKYGFTQALQDAEGCLWNGKPPSALRNVAYGANLNLPLNHKIEGISGQVECHFHNESQLTLEVELYKWTVKKPTNTAPHALWDAAYTNLGGSDGGVAAYRDSRDLGSQTYDAPDLASYWHTRKTTVTLLPGEFRDWTEIIPYKKHIDWNKIVVSGTPTAPVTPTYDPKVGGFFLNFRVRPKAVFDSNGKVALIQESGTTGGLAFWSLETTAMRCPANAATTSNVRTLTMWNGLDSAAGYTTGTEIEIDNPVAPVVNPT